MKKTIRTNPITGKVVIKENDHKTVIINNPKAAARYMKRTAIVIAPSPIEKAVNKTTDFMRTTAGKITIASALGVIGAGTGLTIALKMRKANKLKRIASAIINDAADALDLSDVNTLDEFLAVLTAYVARHNAYIAYETCDKQLLLRLIQKTAVELWLNRDECDCGCMDEDEYDDEDLDDEDDDEDDEVIEPEPPTREEVEPEVVESAAVEVTETPETVEVTRTEVKATTDAAKEPYAPQSQVERFNARLDKKKHR